MHALLTTVSEELPDVPLYYSMHEICSVLRCTPPRGELMRSALINAGYRVSGSHASPLALKTDAPMEVSAASTQGASLRLRLRRDAMRYSREAWLCRAPWESMIRYDRYTYDRVNLRCDAIGTTRYEA